MKCKYHKICVKYDDTIAECNSDINADCRCYFYKKYKAKDRWKVLREDVWSKPK